MLAAKRVGVESNVKLLSRHTTDKESQTKGTQHKLGTLNSKRDWMKGMHSAMAPPKLTCGWQSTHLAALSALLHYRYGLARFWAQDFKGSGRTAFTPIRPMRYRHSTIVCVPGAGQPIPPLLPGAGGAPAP